MEEKTQGLDASLLQVAQKHEQEMREAKDVIEKVAKDYLSMMKGDLFLVHNRLSKQDLITEEMKIETTTRKLKKALEVLGVEYQE